MQSVFLGKVFILTASIKRNSIRSPGPMLRSYEAAAKLPAASSLVRVVSTSHHWLSLSRLLNPPSPPPPPSPAPHIAIEILLLGGNPLPWQLASCLTYINAGMHLTGVAEERSRGVLTSASYSCRTRQAFLQWHHLMHNVCVCVCVCCVCVCVFVDLVSSQQVQNRLIKRRLRCQCLQFGVASYQPLGRSRLAVKERQR